jgi:hypothetical protein
MYIYLAQQQQKKASSEDQCGFLEILSIGHAKCRYLNSFYNENKNHSKNVQAMGHGGYITTGLAFSILVQITSPLPTLCKNSKLRDGQKQRRTRLFHGLFFLSYSVPKRDRGLKCQRNGLNPNETSLQLKPHFLHLSQLRSRNRPTNTDKYVRDRRQSAFLNAPSEIGTKWILASFSCVHWSVRFIMIGTEY